MDMNSLFGGRVQLHGPGIGIIEVPSSPGAVGALGDDAAVMMISGLGRGDDYVPAALLPQSTETMDKPWLTAQGTAAVVRANPLQQRVSLLGVELPLWVWLLIGAGLVGAGWFFFKRR